MTEDNEKWRRGEEGGQAGRSPVGRHRRVELSREGAQLGTSALPVRDHETARLRAKLMNPEDAYADLIEGLSFAYVQAGKPSLSTLGRTVGYSKATLSKVLSGKAMPSWKLVLNLGTAFRVPVTTVQDWSAFWTAANLSRRKPAAVQGRASVPAVPGTVQDTGSGASQAQTGYTCPQCGSWVVDTTRHTGWHMRMEPTRRAAPPTESLGEGWNARSEELNLLREALGGEAES